MKLIVFLLILTSCAFSETNSSKSILVEILMKYGANPLNAAMESEDYGSVQILIENGADINSRGKFQKINDTLYCDGMTILEKAVEMGNIDLVEYFLLNKADPLNKRQCTFVNKQTLSYPPCINFETTAMHDAIQAGHLDMVMLFDRYGADLNAICYSKNGRFTPLQVSLMYGQKEIAAYLISRDVLI